MVALRKALKSVGLDASERLAEIESRIVSQTSSHSEARDLYYAAVSGDAALLWELFKDVRERVCDERLRAAFAAMEPNVRLPPAPPLKQAAE